MPAIPSGSKPSVWLALALVASLSPTLVLSASAANVRFPPPTVTVTGSLSEGSTVTIEVEGVEPVDPDDPDASGPGGFFQLDGWFQDSLRAQWDDEDQVWRAQFEIPPGQRDASLTIVVVPPGLTPITQSFTVS